MVKNEKTSENVKKLDQKKLIILIAAIVVFAGVVVYLFIQQGGFYGGVGMLDGDELDFETGSKYMYSIVDGGVAAVSTTGIQCYDRAGNVTINEKRRLSEPEVYACEKYAVAYERGGSQVIGFSQGSINYEITAKNDIISATVNKKGWTAVCTPESGYKGVVTVYDASGTAAFEWYSGEGYLLQAVVSPDSKKLAVITVGEAGGRIVFLSFSSEETLSSNVFDGEIVLEAKFTSNNEILVVSETAVFSMNTDGEQTWSFEFNNKYLSNYSIGSDDYTALVLNDYQVGNKYSIITIDRKGTVIKSEVFEQGIFSVSSAGKYLAILHTGGLTVLDKELNTLNKVYDTNAAEQVFMRPNGVAIITDQHSAKAIGIS